MGRVSGVQVHSRCGWIPRVQAEWMGLVMKGHAGRADCGSSSVGSRRHLGECVARSYLWEDHNSRGTEEAFICLVDFTGKLVTWGGIVLYNAHSIFTLCCLIFLPI